MRELDYIVVGQGIAGSCLAFELLSRGKSVAIIDAEWKDAACLAAAGVINPITGQRLVKSWRSGLAHPYAKNFYSRIEKILGAHFYHERKILQLCKSEEECVLWAERKLQDDYREFVGERRDSGAFPSLNDSRGSWFIEHSAWVEPRAAMSAFKIFFSEKGVLISETFDFSALRAFAGGFEYRGLSAKKIVFCDGWRAVDNPWFSWLPYRPAKGEVLTISSDAELPPHIVHRGNWIMKCGDGLFRIGSTWDRENLNSVPTEAARAELLAAAPNFFKEPHNFKVSEHCAGVRPCTATTRPHLGAHPANPRVLSFNGFGSKGYALCPYFARHFAEYLENGAPLDSEADLKRHVRKFYRP